MIHSSVDGSVLVTEPIQQENISHNQRQMSPPCFNFADTSLQSHPGGGDVFDQAREQYKQVGIILHHSNNITRRLERDYSVHKGILNRKRLLLEPPIGLSKASKIHSTCEGIIEYAKQCELERFKRTLLDSFDSNGDNDTCNVSTGLTSSPPAQTPSHTHCATCTDCDTSVYRYRMDLGRMLSPDTSMTVSSDEANILPSTPGKGQSSAADGPALEIDEATAERQSSPAANAQPTQIDEQAEVNQYNQPNWHADGSSSSYVASRENRNGSMAPSSSNTGGQVNHWAPATHTPTGTPGSVPRAPTFLRQPLPVYQAPPSPPYSPAPPAHNENLSPVPSEALVGSPGSENLTEFSASSSNSPISIANSDNPVIFVPSELPTRGQIRPILSSGMHALAMRAQSEPYYSLPPGIFDNQFEIFNNFEPKTAAERDFIFQHAVLGVPFQLYPQGLYNPVPQEFVAPVPPGDERTHAVTASSPVVDKWDGRIPISPTRRCVSCNTTSSPCWRPSWSPYQGQLCNSCGLRFKKTKARCLSCKKIPSKGEWLVMEAQASYGSSKDKRLASYTCLQCSGPVELTTG